MDESLQLRLMLTKLILPVLYIEYPQKMLDILQKRKTSHVELAPVYRLILGR